VRVTRFNFAGTTRGVRPTPQGGLCVEAAVARTGVLQYGDGSGRTWLEYRPESEVFAADSLASLRGAPVTDEHPAGLVTPETFTTVSRGHTADDVRRDGDFVVADLLVQDGELCRKVDAGERREVSCGYTCEVDPTPGVTPEGERYDAVQRNIRHNHVALLAPGEGRSGPEVSLRMDGAAVEVRLDAAKERATVKTIRLNGRTIRLDEGEDDKKVQADVDVLQKKADEGGDALATAQGLQEKITGLLADVAMLQGQLTAAQAVPAAEPTEESIPAAVADALVARRLALVTDARKVLGPDVKLDGLSADAIRRLAVEKALPDQKARLDAKDAKGQPSMHPAELLGLFTGVVSASRNDGLARAHRAFVAPDTRTDGDEDPQATAAAATTTRWQKPLSMSATKGS
jgi:hypothetical protein